VNIADYAERDAVALAALVRSGQVSALEVTEAAIGAIEALDPALNALVLKDVERARERARRVRRDLPLSGVPFLIKDIGVYTEEWPTTMSSRFFLDAAARPDSEIVKRWRAAGTVFLGKTNTPEFADDFVTEPLVGRQDQDHELLRLAADLERATGWTQRHPPSWAGRSREPAG
jgi:amidase